MLAWYIFLYPFTFNLYASLHLKWNFCRKHIVESCFWIHSDNLCLLIGAFRPLTFKMIIDIVGLISTILVTVFFIHCPCSLFLFLSSTFFLLFVVLLSILCDFTFSYFLAYQLCFFFSIFLMIALELQYTYTTNPSLLSDNTLPLHG